MRTWMWLLGTLAAAALVFVGVRGLTRPPEPVPQPVRAPVPDPPRTAPPPGNALPAPVAPPPAMAKPELPARTKLVHGLPRARGVALTFDDGPHPGYTRRILALLAAYHVPATFFVVGKMAEQYPELVAEEHAQGHLVADHGYNHVDMSRLSRSAARTEWARCKQVIRDIIGEEPRFCRPPAGHYNRTTIAAAGDEDMTLVLWSRYPADYSRPSADAIAGRVLRDVRGGDIILLHDGIEETIEALPRIIAGLRAEGFELQTIDQMAQDISSPPPADTTPQEEARDRTPGDLG